MIQVTTTFPEYAIIETGGKQYQAVVGKTVAIEKLPEEAGATVTFDKVLFRKNGEESFEFGKPYLTGTVKATIIKHSRGPKLIVFKFKRRKKSRVKMGHRQEMTIVRIVSIK